MFYKIYISTYISSSPAGVLDEIRAHWSTCTLIENKQQQLPQKHSTICSVFLQLCDFATYFSQRQGFAEFVLVFLVFPLLPKILDDSQLGLVNKLFVRNPKAAFFNIRPTLGFDIRILFKLVPSLFCQALRMDDRES